MNRRGFFKWLSGLALTGLATASYGFIIEPGLRLRTTTYAFIPPHWTPGLKLRIVLLADPHLTVPYMTLARWQRIIAAANELKPDVHLLLGDYFATHRFQLARVPIDDCAKAMTALQAPLGTFAICGNHDWWMDAKAQKLGQGPTAVQMALEARGIPVLENRAMRLVKDGMPFWLTGTASMIAIHTKRHVFESRALLPETLAQVTDDAPIIHMAHEPDLFIEMPERVSLTVSGHTHGGQVRLLGYSPVVPSSYGNRFAYGHVIEEGRHLIVSGGLGCSTLPVRFGSPPEIVVLELG
jgi:uncharacterized protein